jgi:hypothetical protein
LIPILKRNATINTNTTTDPFEEYLIENRQRNHIADHYKLSKIYKAAATSDPLETTEPDSDNVTLDPLADESSSNVCDKSGLTLAQVEISTLIKVFLFCFNI